MSNSLKASTAGLAIVDKARLRLGWTKTSTSHWWQDAHTSRATLRRFWQGDRIQREIFIAICQAVGITNWEAIADFSDIHSEIIADIPTPYLDWNEAPDVESFYGRNQELTQLEQWIEDGCKLVMIVGIGGIGDGCKLVMIVGIGGIGKTALALALIDRIQSQFDCLIWKSLHSAPSLTSLLDSLLSNLEQSVVHDIPQLLHHLQQRRCLIILDGLDADLNNYNQFIQKISRSHQSCIIITSREQPKAIEIDTKTVRCLSLKGLPKSEAPLFKPQGFAKIRGARTIAI